VGHNGEAAPRIGVPGERSECVNWVVSCHCQIEKW